MDIVKFFKRFLVTGTVLENELLPQIFWAIANICSMSDTNIKIVLDGELLTPIISIVDVLVEARTEFSLIVIFIFCFFKSAFYLFFFIHTLSVGKKKLATNSFFLYDFLATQ